MRTRGGYRTIDGAQVWHMTVYVVDQERHDSGQFDFGERYDDGSLNRVIDSLLAIRQAVPVEFRDRARCEISSSSGYEGSHSPAIEVSFERPETAEETEKRKADNAKAIALAETKQRAEYDRLKARFG